MTCLSRVQQVILDSLLYGLSNPDATLPTMRKFAQEFDDSVLMKHVELYVNDWTRELGSVGETSVTGAFATCVRNWTN